MGLFDWTSNVFDFVTDTAGKIKQAGQVIETIAKRAGLDKLVDFGKAVGKYVGPMAIAPTPVLRGGQKAIAAMRWTTGDDGNGTESGDGFRNGSRAFGAQADAQTELHPGSTWDGGSAPRAYERRVSDQQNRLAVLRDADADVASIIGREAGELHETRRILDGLHNWLAEYGEYTQTLGVIPVVGKYIQYDAEMLAVSMALADAGSKMWDMHNNANTNAAGVNDALALYEEVSTTATQQDSVSDFDPPRSSTEDLRIAASKIRSLATGQDNAARGVTDATLAVQGVGANMTRTHGAICSVTNEAVTAAEAERSAAGDRTAGVCTELAQKLRVAADKYEATDLAAKDNLDNQIPPR